MGNNLSSSINQCNIFDTSSKSSSPTEEEEEEEDEEESFVFDTKEILKHLLRLNEFHNVNLHRIECCTDIFEQVTFFKNYKNLWD